MKSLIIVWTNKKKYTVKRKKRRPQIRWNGMAEKRIVDIISEDERWDAVEKCN